MNKNLYVLIICVLNSLISFSQNDSDWVFTQYTYESGALSSEGYLHNGKPDGYWKSYYRTGTLKTEGNRKNFQLDSIWRFYGEDGSLALEISYKNDLKDGPRRSYEEGSLKKVENFEMDFKEGLTIVYYPNGKILKEVPFVKGREQGEGYGFDENGEINRLLTFKNGVLVKELKINNIDNRGMKQGYWMYFFKNSRTVNITGTYKDDLKHGFWKYYRSNGNLLRIEKWVNGVLQVDAEETEKLVIKREINPNTGKLSKVGPYRNGLKEGIHQEYDANGKLISSKQYSKDVLLAEGIYDEMGRKQEEWTYYYPSGEERAVGNYKDDLKVGNWKYYFESGILEQTGNYLKDKPEGPWVWYYPNEQVRKEEEYVFGLEDGPMTEYSDSGTVIVQGEYIEGLKEGEWTYTYGKIKMVGKYFEGQKNGTWIHTYIDNGQVSYEGRYEVGMEVGKHIYYYINGQVSKRGNYVQGKRDGIWEFFNESGIMTLTIEYNEGKEIKYNGVKISYGRRIDRELEAEEAGN